MATSLSSALIIQHLCTLGLDTASDGRIGPVQGNNEQTDRWRQGTSSGQANRAYKRVRTIGAGATDSYNTLAAGSLTDLDNQVIDLDELKGFSLRCTSGEIQLTASAGTPLPFFAAAADGIKLEAGHALALSFGAAGLDVTTNSLFEITETSGASSATYELVFHGAN